jgi:hypothetical protein
MSDIKQFVDDNLEGIREYLRESWDIISLEVPGNIREMVEQATAEGAVAFPGYEECAIGVSMDGDRLIYSMEFCVNKLRKDNEWDLDDAQEYFDYNILNVRTGSKDPIFI